MAVSLDPIATFRIEAQELFEHLETVLLDIEANPDDKDLIDSAFRAMHTIKGSGAMFGFDAASVFTHHLETAFDWVRKGKVAISSELVEVALVAKDHMRILIEHPDEANSSDGDAILARLAAVIGTAPAKVTLTRAAASQNPTLHKSATYRICFRLPVNALTSGNNPLGLLDELRELGTCTVTAITDDIPLLEDIDPFTCYLVWECLLSTEHPRSAIDEVFIFLLDDMELKVDIVEPDGRRLGEILLDRQAVSAEGLDSALTSQNRIGALLVKEGLVSSDIVTAALAEQGHLRGEAERAAKRENAGIRVQAERLDELMDQVGELVIAQARLRQMADAGKDIHFKALVKEIERLSSELRATTMGIRMVPIGALFSRFRRLVRDLSRELGKEIQLTTAGEETELDKTLIERLHDPLVHLIRNSLDHGIEAPAEREAKGKSREGVIHLSAVHSGAQVLITIKDDGQGIDPLRVRAKAEETGLIPSGTDFSDSDIFQLIFQPGFSTAGTVTSVSGRGVGMDVVKKAIDGLRGSIDVTSTLGVGATITLKLPLTLAIIDGLLVRVGKSRYVIPLSTVEECVERRTVDDTISAGFDFLSIRGELVPFLRLRSLFHVNTPSELFQRIVIVSAGGGRVGLAVDQLLGKHQTVIKSLSKLHAHVPGFSGATILGDGSVALILDIPHLIDYGQTCEAHSRAS
jgi:two-component system chemotaxis sensor kinase CheA